MGIGSASSSSKPDCWHHPMVRAEINGLWTERVSMPEHVHLPIKNTTCLLHLLTPPTLVSTLVTPTNGLNHTDAGAVAGAVAGVGVAVTVTVTPWPRMRLPSASEEKAALVRCRGRDNKVKILSVSGC